MAEISSVPTDVDDASSEIKKKSSEEPMSVEKMDKDSKVDSEAGDGPASTETTSSSLKVVIKLEPGVGQKKISKANSAKSASMKKSLERSHEEIQKEPLRNDGYCTSALSALDPAVYTMLSGLVSQKITKDRPHFCMFCGHQFISGSGVYIHYYRHKVTNNLSQSCRRRSRSNKGESRKHASSKDVAASKKRQPSSSSSSAPPRSRSVIVNGKIQTSSKSMASKVAIVATAEPTSPNAKPFPTRILPAKTLKMLRDLLKQKITAENPHFCKFCQHPFFSGCGIYIHYLKHAKKSSKQVRKDASSLASAKQRIRKKVIERSSKSATTAVSRKPSSSSSSSSSAFTNAVLDTKTLLMLRDIATRISPEDPHVCEICEHPFYNARGIQAHYLKHAKQKLLNGKPVSSEKVSASSEAAVATKLKEPSPKRKCEGDKSSEVVFKKPSPLEWLRPTVLHMLQGVVRERISEDRPHTCKFCSKVFVRGTGLYFHYLQHKGATRVFTGMNVQPKTVQAPKTTAVAVTPKTGSIKIVPVKTASTKTASAKTVPKKSVPSKTAPPANAGLPALLPPSKMPTHAAKSLSHPTNSSAPNAQPIMETLDAAAEVAALSGRKRDSTFLLCQLEHNTKKLLYHLTKDVEVLQSFGWPQKDASSIVDEILGACNVTPMRRSSQYPSRKLECLRSNVLKLIKFCIRDEVMVAKGWKDKLVDDAVKEIIATEGNFSGLEGDDGRVTF